MAENRRVSAHPICSAPNEIHCMDVRASFNVSKTFYPITDVTFRIYINVSAKQYAVIFVLRLFVKIVSSFKNVAAYRFNMKKVERSAEKPAKLKQNEIMMIKCIKFICDALCCVHSNECYLLRCCMCDILFV